MQVCSVNSKIKMFSRFFVLVILILQIFVSTANPAYKKQIPESRHAEEDGVVFRRCVQNGTIALTFDDGPSPGKTDAILDLLGFLGIPATFFVIGTGLGDPAARTTLLATQRAGHLIGHHSWSHTYPGLIGLTYSALLQEIYLLTNVLVEIIRESPTVLRPPFGAYDDEVLRVVNGELGYKIIIWSLDTNDWMHPGDTAAGLQEYATALEGTDPAMTPGFVTLHHDPLDGSLELAAASINYALSKGYRYVSLKECLGL